MFGGVLPYQNDMTATYKWKTNYSGIRHGLWRRLPLKNLVDFQRSHSITKTIRNLQASCHILSLGMAIWTWTQCYRKFAMPCTHLQKAVLCLGFHLMSYIGVCVLYVCDCAYILLLCCEYAWHYMASISIYMWDCDYQHIRTYALMNSLKLDQNQFVAIHTRLPSVKVA